MRQNGQIVIVTGTLGVGKTTYCANEATAVQTAGRDVAGVLSPARFNGGQKVGIDGVDLRSGERRALAQLRTHDGTDSASITTKRWRFDSAAMTWCNTILASATPCDLLIVDELGPLEWQHGQGWIAGLEAIDTRAYDVALVVVRPSLVDLALERWPHARLLHVESHKPLP
jgi:nucleoside-triphosphatase THEP1